MRKSRKALIAGLALACLLAVSGQAQQPPATRNPWADHETKTQASVVPLDSMDGLEVQNIREDGVDPMKSTVDIATYQGRRALRVVDDPGLTADGDGAGGQVLAIVQNSEFRDGTIEVDVVGLPRQGAAPGTPAFVGIAFRLQDHGDRFEGFYLRPGNSRRDDQLRRNHTTQYIAWSDFPWQRLREESPGLYESYANLEPGAWTRIKVVVAGTKAKLYVNGADQPCLIVNDLKMGDTHGQVALFVGSDTEAYFSNLAIR